MALAACADPDAGNGAFHAVRVKPDGEAVFLNQPLTVYLSQPIDPLSVTPDTVRLLDAHGHVVTPASLDAGSQSITVRVRAPLRADLSDGTLAASSRYTLEVSGYPQTNAVRSRDGRILARPLRYEFETVGVGGRSDYPRPLLPVGVGDETFALDLTRRMDALAGTGELRLHFTLPVFPPSVRPESFVVQAWDRHAQVLRRVPVRSAVVVRDTGDRLPGSTVALSLGGDPPLAADDHVDLFVVQDGPYALEDYAGRSVRAGGRPGGQRLHVHVQAGQHVRLLEVRAGDSPRLEPANPKLPGFEVRDGERIAPRVRLAAGDGALGALRPEESTRWTPPFEIDGLGARTDLASLDVPAGVRLTLVGPPLPFRIRVSGSVRIAGELVLETGLGPLLDPPVGSWLAEDELAGLAGCVMIAAGDVTVEGAIRHVHERDPSLGPALALVAGGDVRLDGRVPPRTVAAAEGRFAGNLPKGTIVQVRLSAGWGGRDAVRAEAWTDWHRIPEWHRGPLGVELIDPRGGIEVLVQTAPGHPIDVTRVDDRPESWTAPRPAEDLGDLGAAPFVRFLLRAEVLPGRSEQPSLAGVALVAR